MIEVKVKIEAPELSSAIIALAAALSGNKVKTDEIAIPEKPVKKQKEESPKKEVEATQPDPAEKETPVTKEDKGETSSITLETVRSALAKLSQSGKQAQVKELITKFGAKKLTEIDPVHYAELLTEAEAFA